MKAIRAHNILAEQTRLSSLLISFQGCFLVLLGFVVASEQFTHWFIVPVGLCGVLIGIDAVDWLRGRLDIFDPIGILGVLGAHFFFGAPLLHVYWDHWMRYVAPPSDWRPWLGYMAALNCSGILAYRWARNRTFKTQHSRRYTWRLDPQRFPLVLMAALTVAFVMQILVYQRYGGIQGFISAYELRRSEQSFSGMAWMFMIAESFPILFFMGWGFYARKKIFRSWWSLGIVLCLFVVLVILFGGLRGSRSNTVWSIFWAVGIIHYWIRPVPKKLVYIGLPFLIGFLYLYGFYKGLGVESFELFQAFERRLEFEERSGRNLETTLLGDLARADVQALLVYRLTAPAKDYEYAWGRTYIGALAMVVPRSIWPDRPRNKVKEGTEALYGMNTFHEGFFTTKVYGLAGETMLNFGLWAIPIAFAIWGMLVTMIRLMAFNWEQDDTRCLLLPFFVNLSFLMLTGDSDNMITFIFIKGFLPFLVIFFGSKAESIQTYKVRHTQKSRIPNMQHIQIN